MKGVDWIDMTQGRDKR